MTLHLRKAIEQLEANRAENALDALLDAWRETREPRIADAIDTLSTEITARFEAPICAWKGGGFHESEDEIWKRTAEANRPSAFVRLLEALPAPNLGIDRLAFLENTTKADPRLGAFAAAWLRKPPIGSESRTAFFTKVLALLHRNEDIRMRAWIAALLKKDRKRQTVSDLGRAMWKPLLKMVEHLDGIEARLIMLTDEERAMLLRVVTLLDARKVREETGEVRKLYQRVYENPSDDEARAVLGDVLQQENDPRGEFIALQLAKTPTRRQYELEGRWARAWLGELALHIAPLGFYAAPLTYERGFAAHCMLGNGERWRETLHLREEWSTFHEIDFGELSRFNGDAAFRLLTSTTLRSARRLRRVEHTVVFRMLDTNAAEVCCKDLEMVGYAEPMLETLLRGPGRTFANVRTLISTTTHGLLTPITSSAVMAISDAWPRVTELQVRMPEEIVTDVILASLQQGRLSKLRANAPRFQVHAWPKVSEERHREVEISTAYEPALRDVPPLLRSLLAKTRDVIERVVLTLWGKDKGWSEVVLEEIKTVAVQASVDLEVRVL